MLIRDGNLLREDSEGDQVHVSFSFIEKNIYLKGEGNLTLSILISPGWGLADHLHRDEKAPPICWDSLAFVVNFFGQSGALSKEA